MYAVVEDVPASWVDYRAVAGIEGPAPGGLVLHVAGPTEEGFRTIEVWESEEAWLQFRAGRPPARGAWPPPVLRQLHPENVVYGHNKGHA